MPAPGCRSTDDTRDGELVVALVAQLRDDLRLGGAVRELAVEVAGEHDVGRVTQHLGSDDGHRGGHDAEPDDAPDHDALAQQPVDEAPQRALSPWPAPAASPCQRARTASAHAVTREQGSQATA